jgi:hypothetical protein
MQDRQIVGYRVIANGCYVNEHGERCSEQDGMGNPCTHAEAYHRVSLFIGRNPNSAIPSIMPVEEVRELTPVECGARELGSLLQGLCRRNGIDLGLTSAQIERKIAQELVELGASPVVSQLPR